MSIDITPDLLTIEARLAPLRITNQVEINIKDATTYGEPFTDRSIAIIYQGLIVGSQTNLNNPAIATIKIQLLFRNWDPLSETEMQALLKSVRESLFRFKPVAKTLRELQLRSENPVNVQGGEGRQSYQQTYDYEVFEF